MSPRARTTAALTVVIVGVALYVLPIELFGLAAVVVFVAFCACVAAVQYEKAIGVKAENVHLRADNRALVLKNIALRAELAKYKAATTAVPLLRLTDGAHTRIPEPRDGSAS